MEERLDRAIAKSKEYAVNEFLAMSTERELIFSGEKDLGKLIKEISDGAFLILAAECSKISREVVRGRRQKIF